MIGMKDIFKDILDYYVKKKPNKQQYYDDIMREYDKIFTQSIPVFTSLLRPYDFDSSMSTMTFGYEDTNAVYNMINKYKTEINRVDIDIMKDKTDPKNTTLYNMQMKINKIYHMIEMILSKKKGSIRTLIGGRFNFTSRDVIVGNPSLRIDQILLPYAALTNLLQYQIINILQKSYSMSYSDANDFWYQATLKENKVVKDIIMSLIKTHKSGRGLPMIINRNPTICLGSVLQMFCVGMTSDFTMGVPLQILRPLAADFDKLLSRRLVTVCGKLY